MTFLLLSSTALAGSAHVAVHGFTFSNEASAELEGSTYSLPYDSSKREAWEEAFTDAARHLARTERRSDEVYCAVRMEWELLHQPTDKIAYRGIVKADGRPGTPCAHATRPNRRPR
jgi:hypothetical protein